MLFIFNRGGKSETVIKFVNQGVSGIHWSDDPLWWVKEHHQINILEMQTDRLAPFLFVFWYSDYKTVSVLPHKSPHSQDRNMSTELEQVGMHLFSWKGKETMKIKWMYFPFALYNQKICSNSLYYADIKKKNPPIRTVQSKK